MTKKQKKPKEKYRYILPNKVAKKMGSVSMRTQMEASIFSIFLLLIGLTAMMFYMLFSQQSSLLYKIIIIFNLVCGWVLMSSYLATTYQQYISYMSSMGIDPQKEKEEVRKKGNLIKRINLAIKRQRAKKRLEKRIKLSSEVSEYEPEEIKKIV